MANYDNTYTSKEFKSNIHVRCLVSRLRKSNKNGQIHTAYKLRKELLRLRNEYLTKD